MQFRSRLRRGISLEVIFEEDDLHLGQRGSPESRLESRNSGGRRRRSPSLLTLNEAEDNYPSSWDDEDEVDISFDSESTSSGGHETDDFSLQPSSVFSRRRILGLTQVYQLPSQGSSPSGQRTPQTIGELRNRNLNRCVEYLNSYRMADLLVNDNIVIVDTSVSSSETEELGKKCGDAVDAGGCGNEVKDRAIPQESVDEMPVPNTVRRFKNKFEEMARREPDSYVIWRDTARFSGIKTNPSSKILRSDGAVSPDDCHRLFHQELNELFRSRLQHSRMSEDQEILTSSSEVTGGLADDPAAVSDADSMFSSEEGDFSDDSTAGGAAQERSEEGTKRVSKEVMARIRSHGVSVTYYGPRGRYSRPSLGHLVSQALQRQSYVAVATNAPRVIAASPKLDSQQRFNTLPTPPRVQPLAEVLRAATLRPRSPGGGSTRSAPGGSTNAPLSWRQTGRCYVFDFRNSRAQRPPPPVKIKPPPATGPCQQE